MRVFVSFSPAMAEYTQMLAALFSAQDIVLVGNRAEVTTVTALDSITKSDVFLSLVSDASPHVYLEMGYAIGNNVPVVIGASSEIRLPVDIAGFRYIVLSGNAHADFDPLANAIRRAGGAEERPLEALTADELAQAVREDFYRIESLTPHQFEALVAELYRERGYRVETVRASGPDWGYDLMLTDDQSEAIVLVECKKMSRQSLVSVSAVHQVLVAVRTRTEASGAVVSNVPYTAAAQALALEQGIKLVNVQELL